MRHPASAMLAPTPLGALNLERFPGLNNALGRYSPQSVCAVGILIGTVHATPSLKTFELLIALATSRMFARLPPGSVQPATIAGLAAPPAVPALPAAAGLAAPPGNRVSRYTHDCLPACGHLPAQVSGAPPFALLPTPAQSHHPPRFPL